MSTILEALKKSEQERRLNNIPTLSDMPTPQEPSRWPIILLTLGLIVLLILMGLVVKKIWFSPQALVPEKHQQTQVSAAQSGDKTELVATEDITIKPSRSALTVSVVSYSDNPSKRFIMMDGNLLREGEFVKAGIIVEEIRQNEVVFNARGEKIIRRP